MKTLLLLTIVFNLHRFASAQPAVSTVNWKTQKVAFDLKQKSLEDAALLFTNKTGCSLLIDGEPSLKNADITLAGTAAQGLDKIANVFDYTWKVSKSGVILMTKRFKNPEERPQMNAAELRQSGEDVMEILKALPSRPDCSLAECFGALAATFTPQQYASLRNHHPLHISDLSVLQQDLARTAIYTNLLTQPLIKWQNLLEQLTSLSAAYVHIEESDNWLDLQGTQRAKGLLFLFRPGDKRERKWPALLLSLPWQPIQQMPQKASR